MLKKNRFSPLLAVIAGGLLAVMIHLNSELATFSSPLEASWLAHGIGAVVAFLLLPLISRRVVYKQPNVEGGKTPLWAYLGGVPGALTVFLAAITVNSPLGLTGSLALALIGQLVFSLLCDLFGWFGLSRSKISWRDIIVIVLISTGSILLIFVGAL